MWVTPKEKEVLKLRLVLEDGQSLTAEEVALHLNRKTRTIKRIEVSALKKIRHPERGKLKDYLI